MLSRLFIAAFTEVVLSMSAICHVQLVKKTLIMFELHGIFGYDFSYNALIILTLFSHWYAKWLEMIVSEYDQEIPQSQTADNPMAPRGRATQPSRDTRKTN